MSAVDIWPHYLIAAGIVAVGGAGLSGPATRSDAPPELLAAVALGGLDGKAGKLRSRLELLREVARLCGEAAPAPQGDARKVIEAVQAWWESVEDIRSTPTMIRDLWREFCGEEREVSP